MSRPDAIDPMDLYLPAAADRPRPAVVVVHDGSDRPAPGYGSVPAARGVVGATVDVDLDGGPDAYERADARVRTAIGQVRDDRRVDAGRIALWFFADSGLLSAEWLRNPPEWLRCVALTHPLLDVLPDRTAGPRFRPITAVEVVGVAAAVGVAGAMRAGELPIVLTRVRGERPGIATAVEAFVATAEAAKADLTIVDVAAGRHTDEARRAFTVAVDRVLATLR